MSDPLRQNRPMNDDRQTELCVLPGLPASDQVLHTRECQHLSAAQLAELVPATDDQVQALTVCSSCSGVIDGYRRRTFDSFEAALEAFQAPLVNRPMMREIAATFTYTAIWIPSSAPYPDEPFNFAEWYASGEEPSPSDIAFRLAGRRLTQLIDADPQAFTKTSAGGATPWGSPDIVAGPLEQLALLAARIDPATDGFTLEHDDAAIVAALGSV